MKRVRGIPIPFEKPGKSALKSLKSAEIEIK